jgi:hypothetical protein
MTDAYCDDIEQVLMWDEEGESLDFIGNELGPISTEAILSADLTPSEREGWLSKIDAWSAQLEEYTDGEAFDPAMGALQQWWDDPELQRLLKGEVKEPPSVATGDGYVQQIRNRLTLARLNVLERSGRFDEFLNLARAEGVIARYTTMLAQLGQSEKYGVAADWLRKAMRGYRAAGREAEWKDYLRALMDEHQRKYKLMPLLKALT